MGRMPLPAVEVVLCVSSSRVYVMVREKSRGNAGRQVHVDSFLRDMSGSALHIEDSSGGYAHRLGP